MITLRRSLLLSLFRLLDVGLMVGAFVAASVLVWYQSRSVSIRAFLEVRISILNLAIFCLFAITWHLVFCAAGLYDSHRLAKRSNELAKVIRCATLGTILLGSGAIVFRVRTMTLTFLVAFWIASTCMTVLSRVLLRAMLAYIRKHGRNLRNIVIVGTNRRALDFADQIARPGLGFQIAGFVDDPWEGLRMFNASGHKLACDFDGFPEYLRTNVVDEVVLAVPFRSMHAKAAKVVAICEQQGIAVNVINHAFDVNMPALAAQLDGDQVISHYGNWVQGWPAFAKRALDIAVSLSALLLFLPVLAAVAIAIRMNSDGPIIFVQQRLGLNKRRFGLYKFRTMIVDAERRISELEHLNEAHGPVFKLTQDPRITPIGRILRKASIDELPQLLNVLKGDMSLVGPRPLPVRDYEGFSDDWHRRRFSVKPGITCLWQVLGRSSIPFEKWMELDLMYIERWSFWLDLKILARTIPAVLRGSGAA